MTTDDPVNRDENVTPPCPSPGCGAMLDGTLIHCSPACEEASIVDAEYPAQTATDPDQAPAPLTLETLERVMSEIGPATPFATVFGTPRGEGDGIHSWIRDALIQGMGVSRISSFGEVNSDRGRPLAPGETIQFFDHNAPRVVTPEDDAVREAAGWPAGHQVRPEAEAAQREHTQRHREIIDRLMTQSAQYYRGPMLSGITAADDDVPPVADWWWRQKFDWAVRRDSFTAWRRRLRTHFSLRVPFDLPNVPHQQHRHWRWFGLVVMVREGDEWPFGFPLYYGMAWRDWTNGRAWAMPIPINMLVGWAMAFRARLQRGVEDGEYARRSAISHLERRLENAQQANSMAEHARERACLICGGQASHYEHHLSICGENSRDERGVSYHAFTPGFPWDSLEVDWDHEAVKELDESKAREIQDDG